MLLALVVRSIHCTPRGWLGMESGLVIVAGYISGVRDTGSGRTLFRVHRHGDAPAFQPNSSRLPGAGR
ncbi:hypothetical protein BO78DRAFT_178643 [Aspergillus sclerotiicarbonarius CBS 121057]|uniref:Uncharacterized protein n=1 Tax=Aspergillus sclerotiicarbonarius (strain CBS 121057 / IBT 28362) TaxID=1448318 RepID=A0A319E1S9_ASPSB|nr:hypothetical protein BO78DRAFT_178643 [Aspergillus sclerotiicarbonarius CBS 121057]